MAAFTLVPLTVTEGVWHGVLRPAADGAAPPEVRVTHLERPLPDVSVAPDGRGGWVLSFPLPPQVLSQGVQTILISEAASGERLGAFTIAMGDALEGDIRAEIDLLRAELDMLKRAFRRHCVETG
ncbi:hypothetical protein [Oceaniglobus roseus]|uniref:hypothetical protein n=1 Tax=Oceaniglobus roseus TaxID=1737570 RepID=UPI000C7F4A3D|nr:hypothetical protein [Kandeliimicrobium roseum]